MELAIIISISGQALLDECLPHEDQLMTETCAEFDVVKYLTTRA